MILEELFKVPSSSFLYMTMFVGTLMVAIGVIGGFATAGVPQQVSSSYLGMINRDIGAHCVLSGAGAKGVGQSGRSTLSTEARINRDIGTHCVLAEAATRITHLEEAVTKLKHDEMITQVFFRLNEMDDMLDMVAHSADKNFIRARIVRLKRHADSVAKGLKAKEEEMTLAQASSNQSSESSDESMSTESRQEVNDRPGGTRTRAGPEAKEGPGGPRTGAQRWTRKPNQDKAPQTTENKSAQVDEKEQDAKDLFLLQKRIEAIDFIIDYLENKKRIEAIDFIIDYLDNKLIAGNAKKGNANKGNANKGNANDGNANRGNANKGNANKGNAKDGNANDGNAIDENANKGNANKGNANKGNANKGNANKGNANKGNANKGNANKGNANKGNANKGDANKGDANKGNANKGNADKGNANEGQC
eukprot:gene6521-3161_t